jgi:hypothetical protein
LEGTIKEEVKEAICAEAGECLTLSLKELKI